MHVYPSQASLIAATLAEEAPRDDLDQWVVENRRRIPTILLGRTGFSLDPLALGARLKQLGDADRDARRELREWVVAAVRVGMPAKEVARKSGVTRNTVLAWAEKSADRT